MIDDDDFVVLVLLWPGGVIGLVTLLVFASWWFLR